MTDREVSRNEFCAYLWEHGMTEGKVDPSAYPFTTCFSDMGGVVRARYTLLLGKARYYLVESALGTCRPTNE